MTDIPIDPELADLFKRYYETLGPNIEDCIALAPQSVGIFVPLSMELERIARVCRNPPPEHAAFIAEIALVLGKMAFEIDLGASTSRNYAAEVKRMNSWRN